MGAKGLPVRAVPKQGVIALMGNDVVNVAGRLAAHDAMRMGKQEGGAGFLPLAGVTTLPGSRATAIMASLAGAVAGLLASATLTGRNDLATTAKAGRCDGH
jgi:hypothetical protein